MSDSNIIYVYVLGLLAGKRKKIISPVSVLLLTTQTKQILNFT